MDRSRDGVITIEEFMESCQKVDLYNLLFLSKCKTSQLKMKYLQGVFQRPGLTWNQDIVIIVI